MLRRFSSSSSQLRQVVQAPSRDSTDFDVPEIAPIPVSEITEIRLDPTSETVDSKLGKSGELPIFTSVDCRIRALKKAEQELNYRPSTLPETIKTALGWAFSATLRAPPQPRDSTEEYERLKKALVDILHLCVGFLRHPYFKSDPSEYLRERLILAILRKRRSLHRKKQIVVNASERLHQTDFFASLSPQDRASLHGANDGLIWYILKCEISDHLPRGSTELELALQRSCIRLLDEMYVMWRVTDFRE